MASLWVTTSRGPSMRTQRRESRSFLSSVLARPWWGNLFHSKPFESSQDLNKYFSPLLSILAGGLWHSVEAYCGDDSWRVCHCEGPGAPQSWWWIAQAPSGGGDGGSGAAIQWPWSKSQEEGQEDVHLVQDHRQVECPVREQTWSYFVSLFVFVLFGCCFAAWIKVHDKQILGSKPHVVIWE